MTAYLIAVGIYLFAGFTIAQNESVDFPGHFKLDFFIFMVLTWPILFYINTYNYFSE